ncbi:MAG: polyribonucleotide nucleotidyltransferase [Planctomycetaceae bacterium]|nr:polyribonucleotide nucleotidyltransferase [Planctomycetaceae bacterium]
MFMLGCRRWVSGLVLASLLVQLAGCGTIFWPERKGQSPGRLDPKVVALDAVGLLLFFIPGVIAFAVDFNNGTIYLPPEQHFQSESSIHGWTPVRTSSKSPTSAEIELIVQQRTGKSIHLQPGRYRATKLDSPQELADVNIDHLSRATACEATDVRFRCQSE